MAKSTKSNQDHLNKQLPTHAGDLAVHVAEFTRHLSGLGHTPYDERLRGLRSPFRSMARAGRDRGHEHHEERTPANRTTD
jgi:hypothetical protein